mgnify:CR=1 FL=1
MADAPFSAVAQGDYIHYTTPTPYKFRVTFADKKGTPYSVDRPEEFLSAQSIERRRRMNLKVDAYDLPITPAYLEGVARYGRLVTHSKWTNTAVVELTDTALLAGLRRLPYVTDVCQVWRRPDSLLMPDTSDRRSVWPTRCLRSKTPTDAVCTKSDNWAASNCTRLVSRARA